MSSANSVPAACQDTPAEATATTTATRKSTSDVASLKRLSACTRTWTRGGRARRRPRAVTATGSVLARTAPRTSAICQVSGVSSDATAPTAAAEASTRPTASTLTGFHTRRSSRQDSSSALAYSRGGRTTRPITSGLTRISGVPGVSATTRPATTSSEGAGIRQRRAPVATTVASTTRNKTVPTLRMTPPPSRRRPRGPRRRPGFPAHHLHPIGLLAVNAPSKSQW